MAKKRITLPKNFKELIDAGDLDALKAVFDKCDVNATSGYNKEPTLAFFRIPDELVRWLVAQGADINRTDGVYRRTPLHLHAMRRSGDVEVFLELGADPNATDRYGNTPLHMAAGSSFGPKMVRDLLKFKADPLAKNEDGHTPLEHALARAQNIDIAGLAEIADALLEAGTPVTASMAESVERIGKDFEFHRRNFNPKFMKETVAGLARLYAVFGVAPVKKRRMHDGVEPILVPPGKPFEQHNALWQLLIPSQGPAQTVQGEVIRITGRVHDEIFRNGGGNWDEYYRQMLDALVAHLASGNPLSSDLLQEAHLLAKKIRRSGSGNDEPSRLCELAVQWVELNPNPVPLRKPDYKR